MWLLTTTLALAASPACSDAGLVWSQNSITLEVGKSVSWLTSGSSTHPPQAPAEGFVALARSVGVTLVHFCPLSSTRAAALVKTTDARLARLDLEEQSIILWTPSQALSLAWENQVPDEERALRVMDLPGIEGSVLAEHVSVHPAARVRVLAVPLLAAQFPQSSGALWNLCRDTNADVASSARDVFLKAGDARAIEGASEDYKLDALAQMAHTISSQPHGYFGAILKKLVGDPSTAVQQQAANLLWGP